MAAFDAHDVIVVAALLQLENGFPAFEVMADQQSRLLELRQHAIDGRKARVRAFLDEHLVNVLGREVTHGAFFENLEDAQARRRRFEADGFEISGRAQGGTQGTGELSYSESLPLKMRDAVLLVMFRSLNTIVLAALVAGCQSVTGIPGLHAYKIDIQQGNYVTQDMVAKLKPGMTKSQVRFALGTPLVTDVFHPERWDYVYVLNKKGKLIEQRRIIVVFQDDKLLRLEGDVVPAREAESSPRRSLQRRSCRRRRRTANPWRADRLRTKQSKAESKAAERKQQRAKQREQSSREQACRRQAGGEQTGGEDTRRCCGERNSVIMKVAIAGAAGRMGRALIETVLRTPDARLAAALEQSAHPSIGRDAGELAGEACGVAISDDVQRALSGCDVLIDFTRPEASLHHLAVCRNLGVRFVIGTTGFNDAQKQTITDAASGFRSRWRRISASV